MNYLINFTLAPKNNLNRDLGDTPCEWKNDNLEFHDAPYELYSMIDEAFGTEYENAARDKFCDCFFSFLNDMIRNRGFSDNLEFTLTMPAQFFALSFNISIYSE